MHPEQTRLGIVSCDAAGNTERKVADRLGRGRSQTTKCGDGWVLPVSFQTTAADQELRAT